MKLLRIFIPAMLLAPTLAQAGIPQLEQTEWFASQVFWLVISFVFMFALVRGFVAPSIEGVMKARENALRQAANDADRARLAAEHAQDSSSDTMRHARERSAQLTSVAKQQADEKAHTQGKKLDKEISAQLDAAEKEMAAAKETAMQSVEAEAKSIAEALRDRLVKSGGSASLKAAS